MSVLLVVGEAEQMTGWHEALTAALPEEPVLLPGPQLDRNAVTVAVVAAPPAGALQGLPGLQLIQSLWAGVDGLLADATIPTTVRLARLVDPRLTASMVESVLLHVLSLHRRLPEYRAQQDRRIWRSLAQPTASDRPVSVLGLGELGAAAARALAELGFPVSGWSRSGRTVPGVRCLSGPAGLAAVLDGCEILVNLLPLTAATERLLSADLFNRLPRGAGLVNLGRGRHLVEADLLAALDGGQVGHAVIDVLAEEPARPDHPFWSHPGITLTPHVAAPSDRFSAARIAADAVRDLRAGQMVANLVERRQGY